MVSQLRLLDSDPDLSVSHAQRSGANNLYLTPEEAEQTSSAGGLLAAILNIMALGLRIRMKCRHSTVHRTARVGRDGGQQQSMALSQFLALGWLFVPDLEQSTSAHLEFA